MLRDISRSYLGFPHLLRWLFPLTLTRLFCCYLLLLPGQLELNLCKLPKPAKNARKCELDQIEHSKHNIDTVSLFDLKRINGWWPATGTKDGEQILAVSDIEVRAHAHAGFYIQSGCPKSKQTTNGSPLFSSLATLWNSHSCFSSASWDFSLAISYLFWYFPCPTTDDIYLKWNLDFSNQLAKSKFLGTIGWLKKSEVELQCLTSEGLKLGLVRITGEKFLKETEG